MHSGMSLWIVGALVGGLALGYCAGRLDARDAAEDEAYHQGFLEASCLGERHIISHDTSGPSFDPFNEIVADTVATHRQIIRNRREEA